MPGIKLKTCSCLSSSHSVSTTAAVSTAAPGCRVHCTRVFLKMVFARLVRGFIGRRFFCSIAVVLCTLTFFVIWFNASLLIRQKKGPIDNIESEKLTSDVIDLTQNEIQKRSPDVMTTQKMSQDVMTTQKRSPDMMTTQEMSEDAITEQTKSPDVKASFVAGEPKQLLILAYQRTGSSFFGRIFDNDPDAFYVYEPLDGLYNSLYGTLHGLVGPTDIYHFPDGSPRRRSPLSFVFPHRNLPTVPAQSSYASSPIFAFRKSPMITVISASSVFSSCLFECLVERFSVRRCAMLLGAELV
ncbi:hypothetical protein LSAT2_012427 [Lamellibrachia satsuma]|nr:hypothetical protein LSAT2_012427 [Lamellibrachia satsuma]